MLDFLLSARRYLDENDANDEVEVKVIVDDLLYATYDIFENNEEIWKKIDGKAKHFTSSKRPSQNRNRMLAKVATMVFVAPRQIESVLSKNKCIEEEGTLLSTFLRLSGRDIVDKGGKQFLTNDFYLPEVKLTPEEKRNFKKWTNTAMLEVVCKQHEENVFVLFNLNDKEGTEKKIAIASK